MDIVSFETAKRLKEAGFPQPQYIDFGFGYDDTGSRFTIQECQFPPLGVDGMYFAPIATDIIFELNRSWPSTYTIGYSMTSGSWQCIESAVLQTYLNKSWCDQSAAEASAAAWLSLNANKNKKA
jgi:hypothetical protein